jgi:hypothetical protein
MDFHDGWKLPRGTGTALIDKTSPDIGWLNARIEWESRLGAVSTEHHALRLCVFA